MSNLELALNILLELVNTANKVGTLVEQAKASGKDIDPRDLQQIIYERDDVLNKLKNIAYGGK